MSLPSKEEKLQIFNNDRRVATTYHQIAQAADAELDGRFKQEPRVPEYPKLPAHSPWSQPDPNVEPPLGYRIDDQGGNN
jgi:hypothetical protein